ncbi:MAG: ABC transporter permease, partial [Candidatus Eisenbacteria bacterium]|nr:ABC transporter permease [Candidatus Eisenbacteria bacterium]
MCIRDRGYAGAEVLVAPSYRWPTFLLPDNVRNIANQISVIAILAVGMTMVILTGGIDLSVGSLIALSAVVATGTIAHAGGADATGTVLLAGALAGILACGLTGLLSGLAITRFDVPPFIATLGMMQVASGLAYLLSAGRPIYQVPGRFVALGRGAEPVLGLPYAVLLMVALFAAAHLLMTRTVLGRHIYAVGGNAEASRLAGVRVRAVLLFVYTVSGLLAGLGGIVMASQLKSGAPTYGLSYELYVIAAVVVGGTSLSGGEGRILGTLVGAFIIAVIQNGMNLTNVESYTQKVVLGLVILGAVLLDRLKHRGWLRRRFRLRPRWPISRSSGASSSASAAVQPPSGREESR